MKEAEEDLDALISSFPFQVLSQVIFLGMNYPYYININILFY